MFNLSVPVMDSISNPGCSCTSRCGCGDGSGRGQGTQNPTRPSNPSTLG